MIVDDSIIFRNQIQLALKDVTDIVIAGVAANGKAALDIMKSANIDLCVLDIEMPVMDGLQTLKEMKSLGIKIKTIMFSAQSRSGAEKTFEAMELGAVDFIAKPTADGSLSTPGDKIRDALLPKIRSLCAKADKPQRLEKPPVTSWLNFNPEVLVIASSTGGPNALMEFFQELKGVQLGIPVLVAQHMPPVFTVSLAEQIQRVSGKITAEGIHGEVLQPDRVYVAPGNYHMMISGSVTSQKIELSQGELRNFVRPSADFLFETAAKIYQKNVLGVVLTGMGRDGADGAGAIKQKRGMVMIQNEESCVVFGMPGAVQQGGYSDFSGTPKELARKCVNLFQAGRKSHVA
ncbi:MAG: chemotaxis-specific protein-glutamate methyltransferase CheB [Bdellovibrionota bacterium]